MKTGVHINRLQFLRGQFKGESPLRPPWAIAESLFTEQCERCDACVSVCHSKIIKRGASGFPEMDFSRHGCDFCRACVQSCPSGALNKTAESPWSVQASFKSHCLAERGVTCRSCADVCEHRAIRFRLVVGGRAHIEFDSQACTGCGECVALCPVHAIEMKLPEVAQHE